jgi:cysteine-rich PDZ-binding protein
MWALLCFTGCAYKKGLCARCGKQILDTKMYKQSVV